MVKMAVNYYLKFSCSLLEVLTPSLGFNLFFLNLRTAYEASLLHLSSSLIYCNYHFGLDGKAPKKTGSLCRLPCWWVEQ
jgi:hypothetical protein